MKDKDKASHCPFKIDNQIWAGTGFVFLTMQKKFWMSIPRSVGAIS